MVLKAIHTPPARIYKHLHFKGIISIRVNKDKFFKIQHYGFAVENDLFWSGIVGEWEGESLKLWRDVCVFHSTIFDVGANTGVYALLARTIHPKAKVYAFEPVLRVHKKLIKNNVLNNFDIVCENFALSNKDGKAIIYDIEEEHTYSVTVNKNLHTPGLPTFPCEIETVRLDSYIQKNNIQKVDLFKIDVESHEPEVLEGLGHFLELWKPSFLLEVLNNEIGKRVEALFERNNYLFFRMEERGISQTKNITISGAYCNFFICQPEIAKKAKLIP